MEPFSTTVIKEVSTLSATQARAALPRFSPEIVGDDYYRISTSLKKEDGSRAIGTALGKQHPAYATINEGQPFIGKATLFGKSYMTKYAPIKDGKGQVIGILFVGITSWTRWRRKQTIKKVVLGRTGYAYVLDAKPGPEAGTLGHSPCSRGQEYS